jgi:hypothetical protein
MSFKFLTFSKELGKKELAERVQIAAEAIDCVNPDALNVNRELLNTREEAEAFLAEHTEVNAVKYLKYADIPEEAKTERYKAAVERVQETQAHFLALESTPLAEDGRTSAKVGCKTCGSSLSLKYLKSGYCPVCGGDLRNSAKQHSVQVAKRRYEAACNELEEASQYYTAKMKKYGAGNWLVRVECAENVKSLADSMSQDLGKAE